jgi:cation transport regulator
MPVYVHVKDLPLVVRDHLPKPAQEVYLQAFNNAWKRYDQIEDRYEDATPEETAHRMAWAAVKRDYEKDGSTGDWRKRQ